MHTSDTTSPSNNLLFSSFLVGGSGFLGKVRVNVMSEDGKGAEDISIQNT